MKGWEMALFATAAIAAISSLTALMRRRRDALVGDVQDQIEEHQEQTKREEQQKKRQEKEDVA